VADRDAPPSEPEIVTELVVLTLFVVTVKAAWVDPAETVTLEGTVASDVLLLVRVTTAPPLGAAALSVTVPVDESPPRRLVGLRVSDDSVAPEPGVGVGVAVAKGATVRVAVFVTPPLVAVIVTVVVVAAGFVPMIKPPDFTPWGTVALAGTLTTEGLLLLRSTCVSDVATAARVTTPLAPAVPTTEDGLTLREARGCWGVSVNVEVRVVPFKLALIDTSVFAVTALVWTLNTADGLPAATVTVAGTLASEGLLLLRLTTSPPAGAWPVSMSVAWGVAPPVIVLGETVSDFSAGGCTVRLADADTPLSVAVMVAGVGVVTCPTWKVNWSKAKPAAMVWVEGTGAAFGSLLLRLTTAPPAGAGPVSWIETVSVSPLPGEALVSAREATPGGVAGMVKVPVLDQAVLAGTPGAESP